MGLQKLKLPRRGKASNAGDGVIEFWRQRLASRGAGALRAALYLAADAIDAEILIGIYYA